MQLAHAEMVFAQGQYLVIGEINRPYFTHMYCFDCVHIAIYTEAIRIKKFVSTRVSQQACRHTLVTQIVTKYSRVG